MPIIKWGNTSVQNKFDSYVEEIYDGTKNGMFFNHRNLVIVGDNSSGKTTILVGLLGRIIAENREDCYYIDSKNRVLFDEKEEMSLKYDRFTPLEILKARAKKDNIAKKDIFPDEYSGTLVTYNELLSDIEKYSALSQEFIEKSFSVVINKNEENFLTKLIDENKRKIVVDDNQEIQSLSSSEAAIMRIVMEIEYAVSEHNKCKTIIIDEFDTHLDSNRMIRFMDQLVEKYVGIQFIFVIHNLIDLVNISAMDAILLCTEGTTETYFREIDCDDITEIGQVERIKSKIIGKKRSEEILLDKCVNSIVKYGKLDEKLAAEYQLLDNKRLTAKEKILYMYVERKWRNDN